MSASTNQSLFFLEDYTIILLVTSTYIFLSFQDDINKWVKTDFDIFQMSLLRFYLIKKCMNTFDLWYVHYDSIVLNSNDQPITIHPSLLETIDFHFVQNNIWPECKRLPQLSDCFQLLEAFIVSNQNWIKCNCQALALHQIEQKINFVYILLSLQKIYGRDYWTSNRRRVQASVVHFFKYLKLFILSIMPADTNNLLEASIQGKLCTKLPYLEKLVNDILEKIDPIKNFMLNEKFNEQRNLTIIFLFQFKQILVDLPTITRKKIEKPTEICKYIQIIAPIQLSKNRYESKTKKKKNSFAIQQGSLQYDSRQVFSDSQQTKRQYQFQKVTRKKSLTINKEIDLQSQKPCKDNFITYYHQKQTKDGLPVLFEFRQNLRKYSFQLTKKNSRLLSHYNKSPESNDQKYRKKTEFRAASKSKQAFTKTKSSSIHKFKNSIELTNRSKKSSFNQLTKNFQLQTQQERRDLQNKQIQVKAITPSIDIKIDRKSKQSIQNDIKVNLSNGEIYMEDEEIFSSQERGERDELKERIMSLIRSNLQQSQPD